MSIAEEERWVVAETLAGIAGKVQESHSDPIVYLTCDCGDSAWLNWRPWKNGSGEHMAEIFLTHPGIETVSISIREGTGYTVSFFSRKLCRQMRDELDSEGQEDCAKWWNGISGVISNL